MQEEIQKIPPRHFNFQFIIFKCQVQIWFIKTVRAWKNYYVNLARNNFSFVIQLAFTRVNVDTFFF